MKQTLKRSRRIILFLTFGLAAVLAEKAVAQTCAAPLPITNNDCDSFTVNDSVIWLSFNSGPGGSWCIANVFSTFGPPSITGAELYVGTCTSLSLVQAGFEDIDGRIIKTLISSSTNYLIKVSRSNASSGQINVCLSVMASGGPCPPCPDSLCQLVCNPDLESYNGINVGQIPANFDDTVMCGFWDTPGVGTPDYFNENFTSNIMDSSNFAGTEAPHSGDGYAGFYCFYNTNALYREYIQHNLQQPLTANVTYLLTFWVSLADCSGYSINDLGAYISTTQPLQSPVNSSPINQTPQIISALPTINDTSDWVMISGLYTASGGEQWITIGSFGNTSQVQTSMPAPLPTPPFPTNVNTNPNLGAYYYIDDITLEIYPDPAFVWSGACEIDFVDSTECIDTSYVHHWNFGDPASGANDSSAFQNPSHIFTQNGVPYIVTHTIKSPNGPVFTYTATVVQPGGPTANIAGYQTNNCGNGTINYSANPCQYGIVYSWNVIGGTPDSTNGCVTNINWGSNGGYVYLTAWDSTYDCYGYDTLQIPGCCHLPTLYEISNTTASSVLSSVAFSSCITTANTIDGPCSGNDILISGVFTIDVPLTFLNCVYISLSPNAVIVVNPGQTLTLDGCTLSVKCDTMWDGIYLTNVTSTLNMINGTVLQQSKNGVVSNSGGRYFIENSTFRNNYRDLQVNAYSGTHPGIVRETDFTMIAPGFWPAIPALPAFHTRTVCAIEIVDNADITIGDPTLSVYRNNFTNIFVGVRSSNSRTKVVNCRFANFNPSAQQILAVNNAGSAVVGIGKKNPNYQPSLTVGAAGITNRCVFINTRIAVDAMDELHVTVENNNISDVRDFGVRIQRCGIRIISVVDNRITNNAVNYRFNTGIFVSECYDATINLSRNFILQTGNTATNYSQQVGTGIRVSCVSPADITLTVQSNTTGRVRTGIWTINLVGKNKVFIGGNQINFTKPNGAYGSAHYGIRLMDCATVSCDTNTVTKALATGLPTSTMVQRLRGISIENSPVTYVTDNIFTRLGSGIFGWETSSSSTLACNTMNFCYNGVFFTGGVATGGNCDIGDQINDPNSTASATGNTWNLNVNIAQEINGNVSPPIVWRWDVIAPQNNAALVTLQQVSYNACSVFFLAPQQQERDLQVGTALRSASDTNTTAENRHLLNRYAHRKLTQTPAWLSLGYPDDTLYQNFYNSYNPTNVGTLRQIEIAADTGGFQFVASACNSLVCSNVPEHNLKVIYGIYAATWMQGIRAFSSADSATLLNIALQDPVEGGTAVYSAQVMLDLEIDYYGASSQRIGQEHTSPASQNELNVYPNPASESVKLDYGVDEGQSAQVEIYDLGGKLVLSQLLAPQQEVYTIETAVLHEGVYMLRVVMDDAATESQRLVIVK